MRSTLSKADGPAKEHRRIHGLDIAIENPRGSTRSGTSRGGKKWSTHMEHDYGYIRHTEGADGDAVDVFIGPYEDSDRIFVVNQIDQETGDFDEHKALIGFRSMDEARYGYLVNYDQGWRVGSIKEMTVNEFKEWLREGDTASLLKAAAPRSLMPLTHVRHVRSGRCGTVLNGLPGGRARLLFHDRGITKPTSLRGYVAVIEDDDDVRKAPFCAAARRLTAT